MSRLTHCFVHVAVEDQMKLELERVLAVTALRAPLAGAVELN
jgi:hypothetical protein